jgi:hypothetical protein
MNTEFFVRMYLGGAAHRWHRDSGNGRAVGGDGSLRSVIAADRTSSTVREQTGVEHCRGLPGRESTSGRGSRQRLRLPLAELGHGPSDYFRRGHTPRDGRRIPDSSSNSPRSAADQAGIYIHIWMLSIALGQGPESS